MAKRLRKEEQIMPDIRILTEGDSSVLVEFGKEISPEINRKITGQSDHGLSARPKLSLFVSSS